MLTYRDVSDLLNKYLTIKLVSAKVDFGKYGELPIETPSVLLYVEPEGKKDTNANTFTFRKWAKVNIFVCEGGEEIPHEAAAKAVKLAEKVEKLISEFPQFADENKLNINSMPTTIQATDQPMSFDGYYSDIAVVNLEFLLTYSAHYEAE
jgi:hypothetical protein